MKRESRPTPAAREKSDNAAQAAKTPNADMQPEDAGSTDSGTAASRAIAQGGKPKTGAQSGGKRRSQS